MPCTPPAESVAGQAVPHASDRRRPAEPALPLPHGGPQPSEGAGRSADATEPRAESARGACARPGRRQLLTARGRRRAAAPDAHVRARSPLPGASATRSVPSCRQPPTASRRPAPPALSPEAAASAPESAAPNLSTNTNTNTNTKPWHRPTSLSPRPPTTPAPAPAQPSPQTQASAASSWVPCSKEDEAPARNRGRGHRGGRGLPYAASATSGRGGGRGACLRPRSPGCSGRRGWSRRARRSPPWRRHRW